MYRCDSVLVAYKGIRVVQVVSVALVFSEVQREVASGVLAQAHRNKYKNIVDASKSKMSNV
jgi:hypothetical protein